MKTLLFLALITVLFVVGREAGHLLQPGERSVLSYSREPASQLTPAAPLHQQAGYSNCCLKAGGSMPGKSILRNRNHTQPSFSCCIQCADGYQTITGSILYASIQSISAKAQRGKPFQPPRSL